MTEKEISKLSKESLLKIAKFIAWHRIFKDTYPTINKMMEYFTYDVNTFSRQKETSVKNTLIKFMRVMEELGYVVDLKISPIHYGITDRYSYLLDEYTTEKNLLFKQYVKRNAPLPVRRS